MNWYKAVKATIFYLVNQNGSSVFTRQDLLAEEAFIRSKLPDTVEYRAQTVSRVLQELREDGIIGFIDRGEYRLKDSAKQFVNENAENALERTIEDYHPQAVSAIFENNKGVASEIDFVQKAKDQSELGELAETIVFEEEKEYLRQQGISEPEKYVKMVSHEYFRGYDILSAELDAQGKSRQKHIEVKVICHINGVKSFHLTRNEYEQSQNPELNYYLYCVENPSGDYRILRIKNPDFTDERLFKKVVQDFKLYFV